VKKVAAGCHGVGGVSWSLWHTDTCGSTVGVHCNTPTSVKHSSTHTQESLLTLVCRLRLLIK
jgi:hypothetical protein